MKTRAALVLIFIAFWTTCLYYLKQLIGIVYSSPGMSLKGEGFHDFYLIFMSGFLLLMVVAGLLGVRLITTEPNLT